MIEPQQRIPESTPSRSEREGRKPPSRLTTSLLAGAGIGIALVAAELALRLAGFQFELLRAVQFGWPDPKTITTIYAPDPDLFWVPRDYENRLRQAHDARPAIVFMGDSCTEFGTYPRLTLDRLQRSSPTLTGVKLGVGGWSTEQGLFQFRRDILPLRPHLVVVYFGWNDHWLALGPPDDRIRANRILGSLSRWSRLAQLVLRGRLRLLSAPGETGVRVPLARYGANLEEIVRLGRAQDVRTVLITAPANHVEGREPTYLRERHLKRLSDLVPLHRAYVEETRQASRESGATLCDAFAAFERLEPRDPYFMRDGIHLSDAGNAHLASLVADCITRALAAPVSQGAVY